MKRQLFVITALSLAAALLAGCGDRQPYVTEARLQRGLVIVLPGIEGRSRFNEDICRGLDAGAVNWAIELDDWTSHFPPPLSYLVNLRAEARNRRRAAEIADRIVRYQLTYPGRPVVLVGQSGGGAVAAWVAENILPDREVDGVIMLAASLSRTYMLDLALKKSRRGIVSFHSDRDWVLPATRIAGTMDGEHEATGGREGFRVPHTGGSWGDYGKLYQIAWNPQMSEAGYSGGHLSSGAAVFVCTYVAPLVLADHWDSQLIAEVQTRRVAPRGVSGRVLVATERPAAPTPPPPAPPAAQELSCTLELVHVASGVVAVRAARTAPSAKLPSVAEDLAADIRDGVARKGRSVVVGSFRDLGESEATRTLSDDLAARLTGALAQTGHFRVKEPLYLRGVFPENQLGRGDIVVNQAVREILAGVDYLVVGKISVFTPTPTTAPSDAKGGAEVTRAKPRSP